MSKTEEEYGWTAVPRPLEELVSSIPDKKPSKPMSIDDVPLPDTPLVQSVRRYAEENYPKETFHHCMRIYYYGPPKPSRVTESPLLTSSQARQSPPSISRPGATAQRRTSLSVFCTTSAPHRPTSHPPACHSSSTAAISRSTC